MNILKFQQTAIEELLTKFKYLWNKNENTELIFKSPTGSGKTYMTTSFINRLNDQPDWQNEDVAFFWITFSDDLTMQSRDKFRQYFSGNLNNQLLTVQDFSQGKLNKNDVLFTNWQKLVSADAKKRLLRRPTDERDLKENGFYFEDVIENTQKDNRKIILIIDESHKNVTEASHRDVINKINPKITIKISATPFNTKKDEDDFYLKKGRELSDIVEVKRNDVVAEGLIKSKIICQTEEELLSHKVENSDELMLDLAIEKRNQIAAEWKKLGKNINPLVLIQLPNDDSELLKEGVSTKETIVKNYLKSKGIEDNKIASWFTGNDSKNNLEGITENDSPVDFLLFKLAAGTGWDCPRAHILVMYREIKNPVFHTQTLGRILRMAYINDNFQNELLTTGYLYTNYKRNEVGIPDQDGENKPKVFTTEINPENKKKFVVNQTTSNFVNKIKDIQESNITLKTDNIQDSVNEIKEILEIKLPTLRFQTDEGKKDKIKHEELSKQIETSVENLQAEIEKIIERNFPEESQSEIKDISKNLLEEVKTIAKNEQESEFIIDPALKSDFLSRSDYQDIGKVSLFQPNFVKFMNEFFNLDTGITMNNSEKLQENGVILNTELTYEVMVNAIYHSEENTKEDFAGKNINLQMSPNDVDKSFTWKCYEILKDQTEYDAKIGNLARSWGPFKGAIIQWLSNYALPNYTREEYYKIFLNDVNKPQSKIREAITYSLKKYRPILNNFIQDRINLESEKQASVFTIKTHYSYSDDYSIFPEASKSLVQPFYLRTDYSGRINETDFISYLETTKEVKNWFKNGDSGKEFLGIKFYSETDKCYRLFYPDWIVMTEDNSIYILDTKSGQTASSIDTKNKAEELNKRIKYLNQNSKFKYSGGIVIKANNLWYINDQENYVYSSSELEKNGWRTLSWKASE